MPAEFGAWSTVHNRFRQWRDAGVFEALLEGLIAEAPSGAEWTCRWSAWIRPQPEPTTTRQGCTWIRMSSTPWRRRPSRRRRPAQRGRGHDAENGAERRRVRRRRKLRLKAALLGRSRGGQTSKIHVAGDRGCRLLVLTLTTGQAADSPQFIPVLGKLHVRLPVGRPRTRPDAVAADKAYSSRGNRAYLHKCNIKAVIPEKKDQAANRKKKGRRGGRPVTHDTELYKDRKHHRAPDQQAQGMAWHRHTLRQDPRQLPSPAFTSAPP